MKSCQTLPCSYSPAYPKPLSSLPMLTPNWMRTSPWLLGGSKRRGRNKNSCLVWATNRPAYDFVLWLSEQSIWWNDVELALLAVHLQWCFRICMYGYVLHKIHFLVMSYQGEVLFKLCGFIYSKSLTINIHLCRRYNGDIILYALLKTSG